MNTIEKLGDDETFRQIVERSITSFEDDELTIVADHSFYNCDKLMDVSIPNATTIRNYAFVGCTNLNSLDLPKVTSMGNNVFSGCNLLPEVSFPLLTTVPSLAFYNCTALSTFNLPKVTQISSTAFSGSGLTSAYFPLVTSVENNAFSNCRNLSTAKLPKAQSIGGWAFYDCLSMTSAIVGTELDDETAICILTGTESFPLSIGAIYVPYNLQDKYKTATNWSSFADKIQGYEQPVACQSLTITAEDVPGYKTTTTIHYEAVCTYSIEGMMQTGTKTFKSTAKSDTFGKNSSKESPRQIEISYTFLGQTATTTITQGVAVDRTIEVTTSGIATYGWVTADSTYNVSGYDAYMSDSKGKGSSQAVMKLTCIGYSELTLYIRSNAESSYDYTIASKANVSNYPTSSDSADTLSHTKNKQNSGTALSNYTAVNYTGLTGDDIIYIVFIKDGSGDNGDDRGFVLIPQE